MLATSRRLGLNSAPTLAISRASAKPQRKPGEQQAACTLLASCPYAGRRLSRARVNQHSAVAPVGTFSLRRGLESPTSLPASRTANWISAAKARDTAYLIKPFNQSNYIWPQPPTSKRPPRFKPCPGTTFASSCGGLPTATTWPCSFKPRAPWRAGRWPGWSPRAGAIPMSGRPRRPACWPPSMRAASRPHSWTRSTGALSKGPRTWRSR